MATFGILLPGQGSILAGPCFPLLERNVRVAKGFLFRNNTEWVRPMLDLV